MKITEHEMHGLLAGKCLPADILVGENLAAYLARKFAALLQEMASAHMAADTYLKAAKAAERRELGLKAQLEALAAENAALKTAAKSAVQHWAAAEKESMERFMDKCMPACRDAVNATPATDAYLNSVRAEGIHFAANRMLAAWDSGFIDDTPAQAYDISGAVLNAVEFLPNASPEEFKRDFADLIRSEIKASAGKDSE